MRPCSSQLGGKSKYHIIIFLINKKAAGNGRNERSPPSSNVWPELKQQSILVGIIRFLQLLACCFSVSLQSGRRQHSHRLGPPFRPFLFASAEKRSIRLQSISDDLLPALKRCFPRRWRQRCWVSEPCRNVPEIQGCYR